MAIAHSSKTSSALLVPPAHAELLFPRVSHGSASMATVLQRSRESECYDPGVLEKVLEGLRASGSRPRLSHPQTEVDAVIARWRASHMSDQRA